MFQKLLQQSFNNIHDGNNELALLSIMPIFDNACKKTWPRDGVGKRFKRGVQETEDIITFLMLGGRGTMTNCVYGTMKLPEIIYKHLRNTIIHEGKMPKNVRIVDEPKIVIDDDFVQFPVQIVHGLLIASIGFECYKEERAKVTPKGILAVNGQEILVKSMVGDHQPVRDAINIKLKT